MSTILKHLKQRKRGHSFNQKSTRSSKRRLLQLNNNQIWSETNPGGVFTFLPLEVCHLIFRSTPLKALGMLSLTSRTLRDMVAAYIYSPQSSDVIVPAFEMDRNGGIFTASLECHSHYKSLGILVKRSSCLFSTKERLKKVGQVLDKLRDSHVKICSELGSDSAYSCYGEFLHAFVAGWEYEEKAKAFNAIKGASLLEERMQKVLKAEPGKFPGFEKYIRVFCREIFLDKADPQEISFWLAQILKQWPMCFQANLLFILYGPLDDETDDLRWEAVASLANLPKSAFSELGRAFRIIWNDTKGNWNADDAVSLFEELTAVPAEWDIECIASLLAQCGEKFCCEVLGNKAINGRTRELAYLLYHIWQKRFRWNATSLFGKREQSLWLLSLIRNLSNVMRNEKTFTDLLNQMFSIFEECVIDGIDDFQYASDSQADEEEAPIRMRLQSMISLVTCLLSRKNEE